MSEQGHEKEWAAIEVVALRSDFAAETPRRSMFRSEINAAVRHGVSNRGPNRDSPVEERSLRIAGGKWDSSNRVYFFSQAVA